MTSVIIINEDTKILLHVRRLLAVRHGYVNYCSPQEGHSTVASLGQINCTVVTHIHPHCEKMSM